MNLLRLGFFGLADSGLFCVFFVFVWGFTQVPKFPNSQSHNPMMEEGAE